MHNKSGQRLPRPSACGAIRRGGAAASVPGAPGVSAPGFFARARPHIKNLFAHAKRGLAAFLGRHRRRRVQPCVWVFSVVRPKSMRPLPCIVFQKTIRRRAGRFADRTCCMSSAVTSTIDGPTARHAWREARLKKINRWNRVHPEILLSAAFSHHWFCDVGAPGRRCQRRGARSCPCIAAGPSYLNRSRPKPEEARCRKRRVGWVRLRRDDDHVRRFVGAANVFASIGQSYAGRVLVANRARPIGCFEDRSLYDEPASEPWRSRRVSETGWRIRFRVRGVDAVRSISFEPWIELCTGKSQSPVLRR